MIGFCLRTTKMCQFEITQCLIVIDMHQVIEMRRHHQSLLFHSGDKFPPLRPWLGKHTKRSRPHIGFFYC